MQINTQADAMVYVLHNRRAHKLRHNVGTCLRHVSLQSANYPRITQHAKGESTEKVEKRDFRAVGNGILWLTPCKLACERSLETGPNIVASVGDGRSW